MIFCHKRLKVGCGDPVWTRLTLSPFHEEAVGNAAKHPQYEYALVTLNATAIVVVGNIQPLVKAALDAPPLAVEFQPTEGIEPGRWSAGDQSHLLIFAALGLA